MLVLLFVFSHRFRIDLIDDVLFLYHNAPPCIFRCCLQILIWIKSNWMSHQLEKADIRFRIADAIRVIQCQFVIEDVLLDDVPLVFRGFK